MKTFQFVLFFILLLSAKVLLAQEGPLQKVKAAKIELIKNSLNLTSDQEKTFWPIYKEFDEKRSEIRKSIRENNNKINTLTATDEQISNNLKAILNLRQSEIELDREYMTRFLKVVNIRQVAELYKTDQKFTEILLRKLNNRNKE